MRRLLILAALLFCAVPARAGISAVEYVCANSTGSPCQNTAGTSSVTVTLGTSTTSGEAIVAFTSGGLNGSACGSLTDSGSQVYSQDSSVQKFGVSSHYALCGWYLCGSASGITSLTWTYGSGDTKGNATLIVAHATGVATSGCRDVAANFISTSGSPISSGSVTPSSGQNEWFVCPAWNYEGTPFSTSSPWTVRVTSTDGNGAEVSLIDQIVSSTSSSYSCPGSWTGGSVGTIAIFTFKGSGGGGGSTPAPARMMMGCCRLLSFEPHLDDTKRVARPRAPLVPGARS